MSCLGMFRILSHAFAGLSVRQGSGGNSTDRRQDKSRKVRLGRGAGDRRQIRHLSQGAINHDSVSIRATRWKIKTTCTLRACVS